MHVGASRLLDDLVDRNMAHRRPTSARFLIAICSITFCLALELLLLSDQSGHVEFGNADPGEQLHHSKFGLIVASDPPTTSGS